jgi:hypothetical protein
MREREREGGREEEWRNERENERERGGTGRQCPETCVT